MQVAPTVTSYWRTHNEQKMKAAPIIVIMTIASLACSRDSNTAKAREGTKYIETSSLVGPVSAHKAMAPMAEMRSLSADAEAVGKGGALVPADVKAVSAGTSPETSPAMLIKTGQASIEVDGLDQAVAKTLQLASRLGGYVANSSFTGGRDQVRAATLELKIPAAKYDEAASGLNGIGKLEAINTAVEDVGEEYVDIGARVANSRRLEERLVALLANRTGKLEDVLAVERELARVREEIERYDGRMRFLKTRAAISTLSVTLHEPLPILGRTPGENPMAAAFRQAWRNFVGFVTTVIASLGVLVPLGVVAFVAWAAYRRVRRKPVG